MAKKSLKKIAEVMRDLDFCMMTTVAASGRTTSSRPMSNNGDVDFDGDCYFFTTADTKMARDIAKNPAVNLAYAGSKRLQKLFVSLSGRAKLVKSREAFAEHWNKDLEIWFKDGVETPKLVMIHVVAQRVKYWHGTEEGELTL